MDWLDKRSSRREQAAALIIVLAFVVLATGLAVAYLARTTSDRPVAQSSLNQSKADQLVASATDNIIGDLRQEIVNGSTATTVSGITTYKPTTAGNIIPQRSGNAAGVPNLIRRSVSPDAIPAPGLGSRASQVNSTTDVSANGRFVTSTRWNSHYLVPKKNTGPGADDSEPIDAFTAATPDWVYVTNTGAGVITAPNTSVLGRYAYAVYDEGGLLDMNVAGYPTGTIAIQSGRKGSIAFADLTALGQYPLPNSGTPYQVDRLVGWRNYGTTQPSNTFPDTIPAAKEFAKNFQTASTAATNYFSFVANNPTGFLKARGDPSPTPTPWPNPSPAPYPWNGQTDQMFVNRQQLISFRSTTQFSSNALQYLGTFSRESNSPSYSPSTPPGSTIDYATLASASNAVNPSFLLRRVGTGFTRFDGTAATAGEPLVKTRFPLSRLAWITYKGPSASLATNDPAITQLTAAGVPLSTIQAGTAANIKKCFGLVWDSRSYVPASGTIPSKGQQWVYDSPSSSNTGGSFDPVANPAGNPASDIKRLDVVASENREPDFFELLRATILDGSLGQNTGGGVTGGATVFPDIHMSNKAHQVLSIAASIMDQADPDSIPTRIQFKPAAATGTNWWTAYGVESLPYITQIYPISGISPATATKWATYLLFQLANPHNGPALSPVAPQVRLRVDGSIGLFTGGNGQTYATASDKQNSAFPAGSQTAGQFIALTSGASAPFPPSSAPSPVATPGVAIPVPPSGTYTTAPGGFEKLPGTLGSGVPGYVGLRLSPDHTLTPAASGNKPQVMLFYGVDSTHQFNATMEYNVTGTSNWVPYNHFIGINDPASWINGATVPVRTAQALAGTPSSSIDPFNTARLLDTPMPYSFMKSDPRSTRFGIFQVDTNFSTTLSRITQPLWPNGASTLANGYGGAAADGTPPVPGNPLEHVPLRFAGAPYYPATLCITDGLANSIRNTTTTSYADLDAIIRPGDAVYPDPTRISTGSSTPWSSYTVAPNTFRPYWPVILNRPFRNVAELGYAFRDLPWKSIDLFTDHSADAGLLDVFTINDGPGLWATNGSFLAMGAVPTMIAGQVNLNTTQASVLQPVLAGAIWDELDSTNTVSKTGVTATAAPVMASNVVTAASTTPLLNRSELITRVNLPLTILPAPIGGIENQSVKARREVVGRAISSVSQTRTWNLMIDVIAQSGRYAPSEVDIKRFIVEGEQRYWVHVAIDRFTGAVIDRQLEVVKE